MATTLLLFFLVFASRKTFVRRRILGRYQTGKFGGLFFVAGGAFRRLQFCVVRETDFAPPTGGTKHQFARKCAQIVCRRPLFKKGLRRANWLRQFAALLLGKSDAKLHFKCSFAAQAYGDRSHKSAQVGTFMR